MAYWRSARVTHGVGALLQVLGGVLCILGYLAPWITYHYDGFDGGARDLTLNGWQAALGNGSVFYNPYNPYGYLAAPACLAALSLVPLAMSACALVVIGARLLSGTFPPGFPLARRLYWAATAVGTLALVLMTYTIDPFGLNPESFWLLMHAVPPSVGPGLGMTSIGWLAVCAGGLLLALRRSPRPTRPSGA